MSCVGYLKNRSTSLIGAHKTLYITAHVVAAQALSLPSCFLSFAFLFALPFPSPTGLLSLALINICPNGEHFQLFYNLIGLRLG